MTNMTAPLEVALAVRDLQRMCALYHEALGLAFLNDPEGHIVEVVQYDDLNGYRNAL